MFCQCIIGAESTAQIEQIFLGDVRKNQVAYCKALN